MTLYDGDSNTALIIGEYSGTSVPISQISSTNSALIRFQSDFTQTYTGFQLKYHRGDCCQNSELVGNGFCNDETNNAECNYDGGDCKYYCFEGESRMNIWFFGSSNSVLLNVGYTISASWPLPTASYQKTLLYSLSFYIWYFILLYSVFFVDHL